MKSIAGDNYLDEHRPGSSRQPVGAATRKQAEAPSCNRCERVPYRQGAFRPKQYVEAPGRGLPLDDSAFATRRLSHIGKALYEKIEEDGWSRLDMEIHEHPIVEGAVGEIPVPIDHRDYKGLARFLEKHIDYARWEARRYCRLQDDPDAWQHFTKRQRFKYHHLTKWWYPSFYFFFTYVVKLGLLDGAAGYHYASYKAWYFQTIRLLIREQLASNRST